MTPHVWRFVEFHDLEAPFMILAASFAIWAAALLIDGSGTIYNSYLERHAPEGVAIERLLTHVGDH